MFTTKRPPQRGDIALLGLPNDDHSSFLQGPAQAPPLIREALVSPSANTTSECGIDLSKQTNLVDAGDVSVGPHLEGITEAIEPLLRKGVRVLGLGGDHAVTYPAVRAYAAVHGPVEILHFDAHPDLYDELDGDRLSHACPFARIMEQGHATRLVQVGIRTMTAHQRRQVERFGVEVVEMRNLSKGVPLNFKGPLYLSLDIDVLDPAFAPGISHYEPGGMSTREVLDIIADLKVPLVGADVVEFNPTRDINGMTAMVAAKLVKELTAHMLNTPLLSHKG